nr:DeoR/GlpR family DNA-binding transcription regulator [Brooklawnia cerclae]
MQGSTVYAEERQQAIAAMAVQSGRVSVAELAARFSVTTETIRRDLSALEDAGQLTRVHGGAIPSGRIRLGESGVRARATSRPREKNAIARAALAQLPQDAETTILVDAGTTTAQFAELLPAGRVRTIVTNSVPIASGLAARETAEVILLGGRVRGITQATVGDEVLNALQRLRVDLAFIGTNGFSRIHGLSTPDPSEAAVKHAMVGAGQRIIVLADSSKLESDYLVSFAGIDEVDMLITDQGLAPRARATFTELGVDVVLA